MVISPLAGLLERLEWTGTIAGVNFSLILSGVASIGFSVPSDSLRSKSGEGESKSELESEFEFEFDCKVWSRNASSFSNWF